MKRFVCLLLALILMCCSFAGCSKKAFADEKINIVATVFPPFDFARAIAGEKANVTQLVRAGSESHSFEPTPDDVKKAQDCDLFLMLGGESESWAERINSSLGGKSRKTVVLNQYVTLLEEHSGEIHDEKAHADHEHSHKHAHDEHFWTSPLNAIKMSEAIYNALCEIDGTNKEYYEKNFLRLKAELEGLHNDFLSLFNASAKPTLVFGDRFPFLYLTTEYRLSYVAAFPGCAEQTEPDIKTLISLIKRIKAENIPVVFYTEFSSRQTANMLCEETGAVALLLHSCHNVTKTEMEGGATYVSLMYNNLKNLKFALK
ncbi:MAG: zinc ABC transporter substrate-binding protein [Clostridia bacterium]|nr:zinc ABC transporter substrate-binding protein [Clostridia bacterium]